jgi:hypothetical protein
MNEYKEDVIQPLVEELQPTDTYVEINVCGGEFYSSIDIGTLLEEVTSDFYDMMQDEIEVIFDEVQHQTIIGSSSSDVREITVAMVIHFYRDLFNLDVADYDEAGMKKIVEEVFGYPN